MEEAKGPIREAERSKLKGKRGYQLLVNDLAHRFLNPITP